MAMPGDAAVLPAGRAAITAELAVTMPGGMS